MIFSSASVALAALGSVVMVLSVGLSLLGPLVAWWTGAQAAWFGPLVLWLMVIPAVLGARRQGWPWWVTLASPPTLLAMVGAVVNSAARATVRGGIVWRGTFYRLSELKAGAVW